MELGNGLLDGVSSFPSLYERWSRICHLLILKYLCVGYRDNLWNYMQIHFEDDLNAKLSLTFSGDIDKIQADEGAVVIAVSTCKYVIASLDTELSFL